MDIHDSDSSGTLSSAGGAESSNDEDDDFEPIDAYHRDSILGGKLQHNRRLSTASSNINYNYMSNLGGHFAENTWNDDLGLMNGDNKSGDDSDDPAAGELNAGQIANSNNMIRRQSMEGGIYEQCLIVHRLTPNHIVAI